MVALLVWLFLRAQRARADGRAHLPDWALLGAVGGLAALVREQDGLFLALPAR